MFIEEIKSIKSGKKELQKFGLTIGIAVFILGCLIFWFEKDYYKYLFIVSGAFIILGVFVPLLLKPVQKAWMTLAIAIGWIVSRVILVILFYIVITPIGLFLRITGKDLLDIKFKKDEESNWIYREVKISSQADYEKQY